MMGRVSSYVGLVTLVGRTSKFDLSSNSGR